VARDVAELEGLSAREAVDSLEGEFAEGNPLEAARAFVFPGPIAEAFYLSDDDVHFIQGPVGSGKTTTVMKSRLRRAQEMPRSTIDGVRRYKVLFIRETYRQLWSTTILSYLETFPKALGKWSGGRGDPVTHVIHFEDDFGPIEFVAEFMAFGDDIIASMRGVQTTDIVLNEGDTMPVDIMTVGIGRIDRWPGRSHFAGLPRQLQSYGQVVGDMNAPDEDNWTFKVFHNEDERTRMADLLMSEGAEGARRIRISFSNQPGYGSPGCENLQNLSADYYPRQIALMQLSGRGDMVERMVRNKVTFMRVGEPVFRREFNPRIHISDGPLAYNPQMPLLIGLDQGFKGAAVIAQLVGFYRWRILAELHFPEERLFAHTFGQRLADRIEERFPGARIEAGWGDMAGEHGASQAADENATWNLMVSRAAGFTIRPQVIGTNRIQPRLEAVRAGLEAPLEAGEPGLIIDGDACPFLKRGFQARYVWTDEINANGDKRKVPNKKFTEANVMDALQYLMLSQHRGDGVSPYAARMDDKRQGRNDGPARGAMGHNGGPRMPVHRGGLETRHDPLNPYGD